MARIDTVKNSCISDVLAAQLLYFVDDNGIFDPSEEFKINKLDKIKKDKKKLIFQWLYRVNTRDVTLSNNSKNNLDKLSILNLVNDASIINSIYDLLYPIFKKTKPIDLIQNGNSLPKSKRILLCARDFKPVNSLNDSYIICNKQLYKNKIIKTVMTMIYDAVKDFIIKKNDENLIRAFLDLYPDPLKPRSCYMCEYKKGTRQGFVPHVDIVSFCSVVLAIKGDSMENDLSLHISVSNTTQGIEKKICPLNDGQCIIFERLFHSLVPLSDNREFTRITWIQMY